MPMTVRYIWLSVNMNLNRRSQLCIQFIPGLKVTTLENKMSLWNIIPCKGYLHTKYEDRNLKVMGLIPIFRDYLSELS